MTSGTERASHEAGPLPVPLSALEHHAYCPRQAALILLEDGYADDVNTVRGTLLHRRVHEPGSDSRDGTLTVRGLPVWHNELGLVGVCDVVEIHDDSTVFPVEHKSGPHVAGGPADVQLAGQAMCLEAMFGRPIRTGAIFSGADRRRHLVSIDESLRGRVVDATARVREALDALTLPPPVADNRCRRCSMRDACLPRVLTNRQAIARATASLFTPTAEATWDD